MKARMSVALIMAALLSASAAAQDPGAVPQAAPAASRVEVSAPAPPPAGSGAAEAVPSPERPLFDERYPRYRIQAGDVLEVNFSLSPEFNQVLTVQPDGFISLREVGDVHVQEKTVGQAVATIRKAYSTILREPIVTIVLKDFEKPYFVAGGEFKQPGKYELRGSLSVVQAVALAGGFTEAARHSEVYIFRRVTEDAVEVKKLNVKRMLARSDLSEDLFLKPGDVLWVPQNTLSKLKGFVIPRAVIGGTIRPGPNN